MKDNSMTLEEKRNYIKGIKAKSFDLILENHKPLVTNRPRKGIHTFYIPNDAKNRRIIHSIILPQLPEKIQKNPLMSEVCLAAKFYFPIPKTFSKRDKQLAKEGFIRPIVKPDLDNVMKTYMDALNQIVWVDDAQVVDILTQKYYTDKAEPYVILTISYIEDILVRSVEVSKHRSLIRINNKGIANQIADLEREKEKYQRAIARFKKEETITKYKNKIEAIDNEISGLKVKIIDYEGE